MAAPAQAVLQVSGFQDSKAYGDLESCVQSLTSFLERKASPPRGPALKISDFSLDGKTSLLIQVDRETMSRFTHLDGFTFAGAPLIIKEYADDRRPSHRQQQTRQPQQSQSNGRSAPIGGLADRITRPQTQPQKANPFSRPSQSRQQPQQIQKSRSSAPQSKRLPAQGGRFNDLDGIGEKFIRTFFSLYDADREQALKDFYDTDSSFSLSVQTRSKHVKGGRPPADWSAYIKFSRNLTKIQRSQTRAARLYKGQHDIFEVWSELPKTQHPSLETHLNEWLLECMPVDNLPDPAGNPVGVKGLMITAHGVLEDATTDGKVGKRAFDRTFMIGPGTGPAGIKVVSDMLKLRPYTGSFANLHNSCPNTPTPLQKGDSTTQINNINSIAPAPTSTPIPLPPTSAVQHPEIPPGSGVGEPREGVSQEQLMKEQMVIQLSFATKLKLAMADQCLTGNNWNMDAALANVQQLVAEGKLGQDAFLPV